MNQLTPIRTAPRRATKEILESSIPLFLGILGLTTYVDHPPFGRFFVSIPALVIGSVMETGTVSRLLAQRQLGEPSASIQETEVRRGNSFHLRFDQELRHGAKVHSVGIFLVYRETIQYDFGGRFGARWGNFDRLIQGFTRQLDQSSPSGAIKEIRSFTFPNWNTGLRHPFEPTSVKNVNTSWIIKVRVNLVNTRPLWFEFRSGLQARQGEPSPKAPRKYKSLFDIYVIGRKRLRFPIRDDIYDDVAPHRVFALGRVPHYLDSFLLLERRPLGELQAVQNKLEIKGIVTEIRRAI